MNGEHSARDVGAQHAAPLPKAHALSLAEIPAGDAAVPRLELLEWANRYGLIAVEDLNVAGMVRNHALAKGISDAAWSRFRAVLAHKAESAGRTEIAVDPRNTSRTCSQCGHCEAQTEVFRCTVVRLPLARGHERGRDYRREGWIGPSGCPSSLRSLRLQP